MRRAFRIPFLKHSKRTLEREVDDELAFHFEMRIQRLVASGYSSEDAQREALRQFGDVNSVRESCVSLDEQRERARSRIDMMADMKQDLFYAIRALQRNKSFAAMIVGALAIGIAANTTIFTLIDAVLMRTLPIPIRSNSSPSVIRRSSTPTGMGPCRRTWCPIRCTGTFATIIGYSRACLRQEWRRDSTCKWTRPIPSSSIRAAALYRATITACWE
jgi:hypothetical protein